MRFTALAWGVLGLVGFAVGEAGNPEASCSSSLTKRLTRSHLPVISTPTRSVKSHPVYDPSTRTVEVPTVTGFHVGDAASSSAKQISLTLPMTSTCNEGSTTLEQLQQTSVCTDAKTQSLDTRPCAASFYVYYVCLTTATSSSKSNDFGGTRSQRWVAQFAHATPATSSSKSNDFGGTRSQRWVAQFARATPAVADPIVELPAAAREARLDAKFDARAAREAHLDPEFDTLPEAAREARRDAGFAPSPAITPVPRAAIISPPPFPICTFNLDKGEYICPEKAKRQALPLCSFDLSKGEYVCPKSLCTFDLSKGQYVCPKVAPRTAMPDELGMDEVPTTMKTVTV
ncbi:hypothetical protein HBH56_154300 [Parastagonospora nodorum]|uniref:Uncharacterized protein n=2 Tax=Phaeosphaeria nodorum (strain SN15 / ATCC MYA-4574 / FGSC 10173) TaxID=321614 RepID=A0A7U2EZG6_PHANO|nr:hypothetical protein SNOG_05588 [Parastagonospora nodorum SN15]KAH3909940.1 hypothetical protein HBH56_154300 [Parastagonospora nodorum]EAT86652.1 hypothetical protein SNOG_05588 [Parastagonospora nodorum SN15]KAH3926841.1 hypothetical protein HBH54_163390 [Parastagonospora nodorum]KAH4029432.1 hypothetical protein HBI09_133240 [Parastagonospora nodorum]KAH4047673.1 hypothetical protein HBH49_168250 [Parastagonospora nodorum]